VGHDRVPDSVHRHTQTAGRHHLAAPRTVVDLRQEVFPTPAPLSEQEKLLIRYLSRTPREELVARSHPDEIEELLQDQILFPVTGPSKSTTQQ
jgi:hypothetical protein